MEQTLDITKLRAAIVIIGVLNVKIERGSEGNYIGNFGFGIFNERGERLIKFCYEEDFIVTHNNQNILYMVISGKQS